MKFLSFFIVLVFCLTSQAQKSSGSGARKIISVGVMILNSSTTQGGAGPSGSSVLTRSEFVWAYNRIGFGALFDYDLHGSNEKDSAYGIKIEAYLSKFYFELGYLISAKRAYIDRSIASESGTGFVYGLGARFPLSGNSGKGPFFHASYKFKTQTLTKQDGADLSESITQSDGYPVFGFGMTF
ncbi:MAG: hypothetical protein A2622_04715 [Bdellovibrionales bacterium RIFCSPHIGHO2_01_FULL_40_29]|nr:MAG: hypothetical protein A2622_04715 [Bdellovibrionales bacterium RIFCSPHIGHO2_01_FULL_40_29]OFZ34764.1 MAG: hypothetical protein A3D17_10655 [Bdellovibrionales bacterium RIFCSPHIGHO2_02_FULL_40_15]